MGPRGSGKSTVRIIPHRGLFLGRSLIVEKAYYPSLYRPWFTQFINLISGSNLDVGNGLVSCTNVIQPGNPFDLDGRRVVLIDTPGFDDTTQSDIDVLNTIALFLATS
jgi:hypothetical protein